MLLPAKRAITPEFLEKTPNGLLLIYDEDSRTTHLGWVTEAKLNGEVMNVRMAPAVLRRHGSLEWEELKDHAFIAEISESRFALEDHGGYHCSDATLTHPTFRIYPADSIPPASERNHDTLIEYGTNVFH
ncbi:MAG: hypothetical protein NUW00_04440 [Candidatus Kaiserbacteria bacterium]|nr:hypothetical protein [Candidatus Kaiserbacteria bacterium]